MILMEIYFKNLKNYSKKKNYSITLNIHLHRNIFLGIGYMTMGELNPSWKTNWTVQSFCSAEGAV